MATNYGYDPQALIKQWNDLHTSYAPEQEGEPRWNQLNSVYNLGGGNYGYGTQGGSISIMNENTRFGDKYYKWNPDGNGGYTPEQLTREQRTGWMAKVGNIVEAVTPAIVGSMAAGAFNIGPFSPNGAFAPGAVGAGEAAGWTSGYDLAGGSGLPTGASGGIFGTGLSTGSAFGDWAAKQAASMGLRAGVGSLIGGGSQSTGKRGGSDMTEDIFGGNVLEALLAAGVLNNSGQRVSDAYNTSANNVMNLANQLKDQGKFTPYNISTGMGGVTTDANGNMSAQLSPQYQAMVNKALESANSSLDPYSNQQVTDIANQALGQASGFLNKQANPLYGQAEQQLMSSGLDLAKFRSNPLYAQLEQKMLSSGGEMLDQKANPLYAQAEQQMMQAGLEQAKQRANPLYAQNEQLGLSGAGKLFGQAANFNPEAVAKSEYNLMQQIMAPGRESENLSMETRLRNQGRLGLNYGSYGAAPELLALKEAQRRQDLQATKDSRSLAFDRQNMLLDQAGKMNQFGIQSGAAGQAWDVNNQNLANSKMNMGIQAGQAGTAQQRALQDMALARMSAGAGMGQAGANLQKTYLDMGNSQLNAGMAAGQAGREAQKDYLNMGNGLLNMGMAGNKFIEDMNNSRTSRANSLFGMAMKPEEMLQQNMATAISAGNARSNAEQANARLFGNMGLEAERLRSSGAFADAGFKNSRDNAILQAISGKGGAGGLLAGAGGALSNLPGFVGDLAKKLLASGIPEESLADVMGEMGIEMDQFLPEGSTWGEFDLSNLDLGGGGGGEWVGFGDMDFDLISR
jgi:hypothetical protein